MTDPLRLEWFLPSKNLLQGYLDLFSYQISVGLGWAGLYLWVQNWSVSAVAGLVSSHCNNALILTMGQYWLLLSNTNFIIQYQTLHNNCTSIWILFFQPNVGNSHLLSASIPEERVEESRGVQQGQVRLVSLWWLLSSLLLPQWELPQVNPVTHLLTTSKYIIN